MEWEFIKEPVDDGWYPVLVCYDLREGIFPNAAYWDGKKWDSQVVAHGDKCELRDQALALAYENDPDA